LLVLVLLAWVGHRVLARYRLHQRRKQMLVWVDKLNVTLDPKVEPQAYLSMLNQIFKIIAVKAFPGKHCAALNGQEWADFLIEKMKNTQSAESLGVLASGPYDPAPKFDPDQMSELTRHWIRQHG
jgi:ABC-type uncharacterized transport system YnjBCD permease subunit